MDVAQRINGELTRAVRFKKTKTGKLLTANSVNEMVRKASDSQAQLAESAKMLAIRSGVCRVKLAGDITDE